MGKRWMCEVCERTNADGQIVCWCCGRGRQGSEVDALRAKLAAMTERLRLVEAECDERRRHTNDADAQLAAAEERAERAEGERDEARALLRTATETLAECAPRSLLVHARAERDMEAKLKGEALYQAELEADRATAAESRLAGVRALLHRAALYVPHSCIAGDPECLGCAVRDASGFIGGGHG